MPHPTSYTQRIFKKNNAGGISHRKVQPKRVVHHANVPKPTVVPSSPTQEIPGTLAEVEEPALDVPDTPLKKTKDAVWYTKTPIGHTTLLARKCKVTQQTEQETNSLMLQASTAAHAGTCAVCSDQETVTNTLNPSVFHFTSCFQHDIHTKNVTVA